MTETDWNDHAHVHGYLNKFAVGAQVVGGISCAEINHSRAGVARVACRNVRNSLPAVLLDYVVLHLGVLPLRIAIVLELQAIHAMSYTF